MAIQSETIAFSHAGGVDWDGGHDCGVVMADDSAVAAGRGTGAFDWTRMYRHRRLHHQPVRSASQCSMTTSSKCDSLEA